MMKPSKSSRERREFEKCGVDGWELEGEERGEKG